MHIVPHDGGWLLLSPAGEMLAECATLRECEDAMDSWENQE